MLKDGWNLYLQMSQKWEDPGKDICQTSHIRLSSDRKYADLRNTRLWENKSSYFHIHSHSALKHHAKSRIRMNQATTSQKTASRPATAKSTEWWTYAMKRPNQQYLACEWSRKRGRRPATSRICQGLVLRAFVPVLGVSGRWYYDILNWSTAFLRYKGDIRLHATTWTNTVGLS